MPGEHDCFDKVFRVIAGAVLDKTGYFAANFGRCEDNLYTGSGPSVVGGLTAVFCGPCPGIVLNQKTISSQCNSCAGFVTLLANVSHECRHFKQSACPWGLTPDKRTEENDAAKFTINLLKTGAIKICDNLVNMGICGSPNSCYDELSREESAEENEIS
jgi:hypothetical protein